MSTTTTTISPTLPHPGPSRFWHGVHNPNNAKFPLTLELRQKTIDREVVPLGFSRLIAKQPVIADPIHLREAAEAILVRAGRVEEFTGVLSHEVSQ